MLETHFCVSGILLKCVFASYGAFKRNYVFAWQIKKFNLDFLRVLVFKDCKSGNLLETKDKYAGEKPQRSAASFPKLLTGAATSSD